MCLRKYTLFTIFVLLFGCSMKSEKKTDVNDAIKEPDTNSSSFLSQRQPLDLDKMSEEEKLLLFKKIPTRITYERTKFLLPTLGALETEGGGSFNPKYGLFESRLNFLILGRPAKLEFNFKNDSLYGYNFSISEIDSSSAEIIYKELQSFYSKQFGPFNEERESFEYYYEASNWSTDSIQWGIVKNIYSNAHAYIGWGY